MSSYDIEPVILTEAEIKQRVSVLVRKLRKAFDRDRWSTYEEFEKSFAREVADLEFELLKFKKSFEFFQRIKWYEHAKRKKLDRLPKQAHC